MDIYALLNQKGGVGKTANTLNLAAALAERGERVLAVDFDPQGHLTEALGLEESPDHATLKQKVLGEWTGPLSEILVEHRPNFWVLPTNIDMFLLDRGLYLSQGREFRLARALEELEDLFDVGLLDCPPSLGAASDAALIAARRREGRAGGAIVPVEAEDSSIRALRLLLRQMGTLTDVMGVEIDVLGLVPSRVDVRGGNIVTSVLEAFRSLGDPPVLGEIRARKEIREAWRARQSVLEYAPTSEAASWYRDLAKAVRP